MSTGGTLFWTGLVLVGAALLAPGLSSVEAPPPAEAEGATPERPNAPATIGNGYARQQLTRDPDGHFYAEAQVNGARVRFMVDTGASVVALTPADARRAGIALGDDRSVAVGAGGEVEVVPVTIDRIAIGALAARDVRAAVAEDLPVSLLGQSFLSQVGTVEISGDTMVLR